MTDSRKTLVITGPTATGKTRLAVALSRQFNGEILSADSRQVYRGMDIGTGKDLSEYGTAPDAVPTHLIDCVEPTEDYHLFRFLQDAMACLTETRLRGALPVIAGGTPLYISALLNGYEMPGGAPDEERQKELEAMPTEELLLLLRQKADASLLSRTDITQRKRIIRAILIAENPSANPGFENRPLEDVLILAPYYTREVVRERIEIRLDERLQNGLVEEVRTLQERGVSWERLDWFGLEYRFVAQFLQNQLSFEEMRQQLLNKIRNFAKSQDIWFRKLERQGHVIHWLPDGNLKQAQDLVNAWLKDLPLPPPPLVLNDIRYTPVRGKNRAKTTR